MSTLRASVCRRLGLSATVSRQEILVAFAARIGLALDPKDVAVAAFQEGREAGLIGWDDGRHGLPARSQGKVLEKIKERLSRMKIYGDPTRLYDLYITAYNAGKPRQKP